MTLGELTEFIIKSLVLDISNVEVVESCVDDVILIDVKVSGDDMKRIIGRDGRVINSVRTLIQEASSLRENKYVKVEVKEKEF